MTKSTQDQRLEGVHSILIDDRRAITNVASVAAEHGFHDLAKFNRLFRERYGSGPVEVRRLARKGRLRLKQ